MSGQAIRNNLWALNCVYFYDFAKKTALDTICREKKKVTLIMLIITTFLSVASTAELL